MVGYGGERCIFLFIFCMYVCVCVRVFPSLISCKCELLSRPMKLSALCASPCARTAAAVTTVNSVVSTPKFVTCRRGTSWRGVKLPKECSGYNSHIDAEKELHYFISGRSCCARGLSGRDGCKRRRREGKCCFLSLPPGSRCRTRPR